MKEALKLTSISHTHSGYLRCTHNLGFLILFAIKCEVSINFLFNVFQRLAEVIAENGL